MISPIAFIGGKIDKSGANNMICICFSLDKSAT